MIRFASAVALVWTRAREATGPNIVRRYLDELLQTDPDEPWMDDDRLAYRTRRPILGVSSDRTASGEIFTANTAGSAAQGRQSDRAIRRDGRLRDLGSTLLALVE